MDQPVPHSRPKNFQVEVTEHRLAPDESLTLARAEHTLVVRRGVLYVSLHSGDVALIPGDEIVVRPADFRGAWSARRDDAELIVLRGG